MSDDVDRVTGAEAQELLLDVPPAWAEAWKGMPAYDHEDLAPWQTVMVHFKHPSDREAFAKLVGQHLHERTKFIWYPKATIGTAADKVYTRSEKVTPRYPVYVISKGRWDSRLTSKALEWIKVPYHIVIEPQEYDNYAAVIDPKKILVLPFSNLGQGGIPARNWVWEHAISTGAERHWILDDNISGFCRFQNNLKVEVDSGITFCAVEDFTDRYENVVLSGFNYDYFAPRKQGTRIRPFTLNTRIYSGILIRNDLPLRWRGRYNEDTDLSLRALKLGYCTVLFNAFLMYKKPTLTMKGGNTDELYKGVEATAAEFAVHAAECGVCHSCSDGYTSALTPCEAGRQILAKDGRWLMAESLREQHPEITTVERKWGRWQHQVDYGPLKNNQLVLKPDVVIPDDDPYDMELAAMPTDGEAQDSPAEPGSQLTTSGEEKPATPSPPAGAAYPAGPSALAFLRTQAVQQSQPDAAAEAAVSSAFDVAEFVFNLSERGHLLFRKAGKLYATDASTLAAVDRETIKANRDAILAYHDLHEVPDEDRSQDGGWQGVAPCVDANSHAVAGSTPADSQPAIEWPVASAPVRTASLADFLGANANASDADWKPDEPPSLNGINEIVLNFATDGLDWTRGHRPGGVTVASLDGQLVRFLPFRFQGGNLDEDVVKRWMQTELRGKRIVGANTRFEVHMAREWGVDLEAQGCTVSDVMHYAALLDDHRKRFALDVLIKDYLKEDQVGRVDETQHLNYHASDVAARERYTVEATAKLRNVMWPLLDAEELQEVRQIEDDCIYPVVEMEKNGSPIDMDLLEEYSTQCIAAHDALMMELSKEVGFAFEHTAAGWQRLFEHLGIPPSDSYDEEVIGAIDHPTVKTAQFASQLASLNSKTFAAYKKHVDSDGILRVDINQLRGEKGGTITGRFSIPYVQQVPNHDNHHEVFGEGVPVDDCHGTCSMFPRRLFIPDRTPIDGFVPQYLEADAMQIEYRLFASDAGNARILQAYKENPRLSFHKMTHSMLKPYKPNMAYVNVKSFNFAFFYGARSVKLAVMMGFITAAEGEEIRKTKRWNDPRLKEIHEIEAAYQKMNPEGSELLARAAHLAMPYCDDYCGKSPMSRKLHQKYKHRGYIKTIAGRRGRFETPNKSYIALNKRLQGSGADIMKKKLAILHRERKHTGLLMRLTIHDAVTGDARMPQTLERVREILDVQHFPQVQVPILWDANVGANWAECKG